MAILAVDEVMLREPRLLVPRSVPVGRCRIDWSHPLTTRLKVFVVAGQGDLVTGLRPQFGGTASLKPKFGNLSYQSENSNNDLAYFAFPADAPLYTITTAHTTMLAVDHTASANYANFVSVPFAAGSWSSPYNALVLYKDSGTSSKWTYQTNSSGVIIRVLVRSSGAVSTSDRNVIASFSGNGTGKMYINGVDVTNEPLADNPSVEWNTKQPLCILASSNSYAVNAGVTGNAYAVGIWGRQLTPGESLAMYLDPYQFLIPA